MFKKTTNPNPSPKTENTHRVAKFGLVGAAVALALSLTPLLGVGASAETSIGPSSCVRAVSDSGKFVGSSDGCKVNLGEPTAPEGSTPVAECSDADDAVASALATIQAQLARVDGASEQISEQLTPEIQRLLRTTSLGAVKVPTTAITTISATLDTDQAVEAICAGDDPMNLVRYKLEATSPVALGPLELTPVRFRYDGLGPYSDNATVTVTSGPSDTSSLGSLLAPAIKNASKLMRPSE
jgi:hypothetical protein